MEITGTLIRELPREERPREKLLSLGAGFLSNRELLAILIGTGTKKNSSMNLADKLLSMDEKGIGHLSRCIPDDLKMVHGIGQAKACQIVAAVELGRRIATKPKGQTINVNVPSEVSALFMEEMRHLTKEYFNVLMLTTKNEIIAIDKVAVGDLNRAIVHPREVFSNAIKRSAATVVLVHNHPSGDPNPSRADIELTNRLIDAGEILGISVVDHIVIGDGKYFSMRDERLI